MSQDVLKSGEQVDQGASVLVVDDNPLVLKVVSKLLQGSDFEVTTALNGSKAKDILEEQEESFDLIVSDIMMPEMNGFQLYDYVREKDSLAQVPFLFLSALDDVDNMQRAKEHGADDYIMKPFEPELLIAAVKGKIKRRHELRQLSENRFKEYQKQILGTFSHEFKTPLLVIKAGTELVLDQLEGEGVSIPADTLEMVESIQRAGDRLEKLVNDFLTLQQLEAGRAERVFASRAQKIPASSVMKAAYQLLRHEFEIENIRLVMDDSCGDACIFGCIDHFIDVLKRFASNAIKFSEEESQVDMVARVESGEIVFEVADRGCGIDPSKIVEAMSAFGQVGRERSEQQGSGMGLAIASKYAFINNAEIDLELRDGGGTTARLIVKKV